MDGALEAQLVQVPTRHPRTWAGVAIKQHPGPVIAEPGAAGLRAKVLGGRWPVAGGRWPVAGRRARSAVGESW